MSNCCTTVTAAAVSEHNVLQMEVPHLRQWAVSHEGTVFALLCLCIHLCTILVAVRNWVSHTEILHVEQAFNGRQDCRLGIVVPMMPFVWEPLPQLIVARPHAAHCVSGSPMKLVQLSTGTTRAPGIVVDQAISSTFGGPRSRMHVV